jgi:DNA-binding NarL/FixJ family response regulator
MAAIKIVLADDQRLFRCGLSSLFQPLEKNGLALVAEAANGKEAIKAVIAHQPDVVLMDVVMPEMDGVEATRQIKDLRPQTGVIALSFTDDQPQVLAMIDAGVDGYLIKDCDMEELVAAIQSVYEGGMYFTASTVSFMASHVKANSRIQPKQTKSLTKREQEVLTLICEGKTSQEIAGMLYVSKRTVDSFRNHLLKKTGAKNLAGLIRFANRKGLFKF